MEKIIQRSKCLKVMNGQMFPVSFMCK